MKPIARLVIPLAAVALIGAAVVLPAIGRGPAPAPASPAPDDTAPGLALLERSAKAYQAAPALVDVVKLKVTLPNQKVQELDLEYALGAQRDIAVKMPGLATVAYGDKVYVTRDDVPDKYVEVPLEGDLGRTLEKLLGPSSWLPAPCGMRMRLDMTKAILALGMDLFDEAAVTGARQVDVDGVRMDEVLIEAPTGTVRVRLDEETHLIRSVLVEGSPPDAPPDFIVKSEVTHRPTVLESAEGVVSFQPGDRKAVATLADLEPTPAAVGEAAPDFTLEALDGSAVTLSDLQGSVVVLDFWATWCPPCRRGLPLLQQFADWASEREDVHVYAVDTFERTPTPEATREQTAAYWAKQRFSMPTLLDLDSSTATAYGIQSIPYTLVIAPDGTIATIHRGFDPEMVATLKADVKRLLTPGG
jgi:thiol-disulfide isomerase/thioredoxin